MSGFSAQERQALVEALIEAGPDAPTLCEGWTAYDLAAHLVIRERRPEAALGAVIPPLARYTEKVRRDAMARPFAALVEQIRTGPPRLSPLSLPGVDENVNLLEHFIHCEDVRRGQPGWQARALSEELEEALWKRLSAVARMAMRRSPVPTRLVRPDGAEIATGGTGVPVRLHGAVGELVLYVAGRTSACDVELTGPDDAIKAFEAASLGF